MLLGIFVALKAVAYWLDRYGLAVKSSDFKATGNWTGLRYVDANAYLPAKTILFCIAVICALLFFATLWRRTWQLPVIGFGLMVLSAILIGGLYPAIVQKFQVQPNEQAKEAPYIEKNIEATRDAYGIDDAEVEDYSGQERRPSDKAKLRARRRRHGQLSACSTRTSSRRPSSSSSRCGSYYQFPDDARRRPLQRQGRQGAGHGHRSARAQPRRHPEEATGSTTTSRYTHGYGVVAAKGTDGRHQDGAPGLHRVRTCRPRASSGKYEQRIYYGEKTNQYSIVGGPQKELDYADDSGEKTTSYKGKSGVNLSNPVNRAAYAVAFSEPQILYSGAIGEGSRILYNRTPKERVEAVAPWLTIDGDAYPAVVDGRIQWIVDAYTTTNGYPYASRTTLGDTTADSLTDQPARGRRPAEPGQLHPQLGEGDRRRVHGKVNLYQWDTKDPVLKTWMKAFPGTVKPKSEISRRR